MQMKANSKKLWLSPVSMRFFAGDLAMDTKSELLSSSSQRCRLRAGGLCTGLDCLRDRVAGEVGDVLGEKDGQILQIWT